MCHVFFGTGLGTVCATTMHFRLQIRLKPIYVNWSHYTCEQSCVYSDRILFARGMICINNGIYTHLILVVLLNGAIRGIRQLDKDQLLVVGVVVRTILRQSVGNVGTQIGHLGGRGVLAAALGWLVVQCLLCSIVANTSFLVCLAAEINLATKGDAVR